jgi:hypothetical protein
VKVAANETEKAVLLAQTEIEQDDKKSSSMDQLIAAFKRAAELRDTPLYSALVRGINDGVRRLVIVTTESKHEGGTERVRCLMPYTPTEEMGRRRTRPEYRQSRTEGLIALLPTYYHDLWIRKDRLEMTS